MSINECNNQEMPTYLKEFKSEMLNMLSAFFNKEEERIKKAEKKQEELFVSVNDTVKELKISIQRMGNIMFDMSKNKHEEKSSNEPVKVREVSENNIFKLLETFNGAMENSAKMLCEYNTQMMEHQSFEINKYINSFSQTMANKMDTVFSKYTAGINKCTENIVSRLADELKENTITYNKLNEESYKRSLENVQKENNLELKSLAESLRELSIANTEFSKECKENNINVNQKLNQLINQNSGFVEELHKQSEENHSRIKSIISCEIEKMVGMLNTLEINNARYFNSSMNDYREKFIEANALALAKVQTNMQDIVGKNQTQIQKLIEGLTDVADSIEKYKDTSSEELEQYKEEIINIFSDMESSNREVQKNISSNYKQLTEKIETVLDEGNKISGKINENTRTYKESLKAINENYRRQNDLSQKDIEFLERVMKNSGI